MLLTSELEPFLLALVFVFIQSASRAQVFESLAAAKLQVMSSQTGIYSRSSQSGKTLFPTTHCDQCVSHVVLIIFCLVMNILHISDAAHFSTSRLIVDALSLHLSRSCTVLCLHQKSIQSKQSWQTAGREDKQQHRVCLLLDSPV